MFLTYRVSSVPARLSQLFPSSDSLKAPFLTLASVVALGAVFVGGATAMSSSQEPVSSAEAPDERVLLLLGLTEGPSESSWSIWHSCIDVLVSGLRDSLSSLYESISVNGSQSAEAIPLDLSSNSAHDGSPFLTERQFFEIVWGASIVLTAVMGYAGIANSLFAPGPEPDLDQHIAGDLDSGVDSDSDLEPE